MTPANTFGLVMVGILLVSGAATGLLAIGLWLRRIELWPDLGGSSDAMPLHNPGNNNAERDELGGGR